MSPFKWIYGYIKNYKRKYIAGLLIAMLVSGLNIVNPRLIGLIVDEVIRNGKKEMLFGILGIMLGLTIVRSILKYIYPLYFEQVSQDVIFDIRNEMYKKIMDLDFSFFDKHRTGDIMSRMSGDIEMVRHFVAGIVKMLVENILMFIFAVALMMSINVYLTLIVISVTPLVAFVTVKLFKEIKEKFRIIRESLSKLNSTVQENIGGNRIVKAFAREDYEIYKFEEKNQGFRDAHMETAKIRGKFLLD